jgi:hypothetical protein
LTLLAEVVGVLFGGALIGSLLPSAWSSALRWIPGVAVAVVAAATLLFFPNVWALGRSFRAGTKADAPISKQAAELAGGTGTNTAFLAWARTKIVSGRQAPTFWILPGAARANPLVYQWSTYQLLPARETDQPREANWIVFYGVTPSSVDYDARAFRRLYTYAPGFALAQRPDAG